MKRTIVVALVAAALLSGASTSRASWGHLTYSGYQPWYNIFAKRYKCLTPEEERLQKFWHDYYSALRGFYKSLDRIDWVAYYKNHGYQINAAGGPYGGPGCGRVNYAPVFVSPEMKWAIPSGGVTPPPGAMMGGPGGYPMGMGGPGGFPMNMGGYPVGMGGYPGSNMPPGAYPAPMGGAPANPTSGGMPPMPEMMK